MPTPLNPDELGRELRDGSTKYLRRRRGIIGLSFFSCAVLGAVALHQIGILKKLPEPRWRAFNSRKVNGSAEAYAILSVPDAFLGLASYSVTACLASRGSEERWKSHPLMPIGMGLKLLGDAVFAGKLTLDECRKFKAFSVWSLLTTAATWTALPLAIPETNAAIRRLREQEHA